MTDAVPTRVGPYEIASRIGAGGMGEVWRARDTRIGRDVALKVLPRDFTSSPDRLRRFEQEARAAGSLNHPNLVTIHDLGTGDSGPYIVMELLEGESLRDRIGVDAGPRLPVRKATDISIQIANGLAAAHEKGIVHRDLKPENVFVTRDGRVKILDFGLAKLTAPDPISDQSRTQQRETSPGAVLGTVGYMAPEQVRGQEVDHRTDIFAFGAILYELLTGHRAFHRGSSVETMNAILTDDPAEVPKSDHHVPPAIDRIVRRCLEKGPDERFQSARDLAFALEAVSGSGLHEEVAIAAPQPQSSRRSGMALPVAGTLLIAAALYGAYKFGTRSIVTSAVPTFKQLTFSGGIETAPAIAPDGDNFAFVRENDIYLQRTDGRNAINLTKTPKVREAAPAFSPDGRQIAFHVGPIGGIYVMGATGESVRKITSSGYDPAWSPDGRRIVFSSDEPTVNPLSRNTSLSKLMVVDAGGGTPRVLHEEDAMQPRWSPDGSRIAFWANDDRGRRDIYTVGVEKGSPRIAVTSDAAMDWSPAWAPDGRSLFFSSDRGGTITLWRIGVDQKSGEVTGKPQLISAPAPVAGRISVSSDGSRLTFQTITESNDLYVAEIDRKTGNMTVAAEPVLSGTMLFRNGAVSPDGTQIAFTTERDEDVFVMRSDGSDIRQLTNDEHRDRGITWWPDGERLAFYSARSGTYQLWSIRPDGSELTQLTDVPREKMPNFPLLSPDGKKVAAVSTRSVAWIADLAALPVTRVDSLPLIAEAQSAFFPMSWSPDGRRMCGTPWVNREAVYVYSIADRVYQRVPGTWSGAIWLDDERLLLRAAGADHFSTIDLRTGVTREVLKTKLIPSTGVPVNATRTILKSEHTEGDIWMATFEGP